MTVLDVLMETFRRADRDAAEAKAAVAALEDAKTRATEELKAAEVKRDAVLAEFLGAVREREVYDNYEINDDVRAALRRKEIVEALKQLPSVMPHVYGGNGKSST